MSTVATDGSGSTSGTRMADMGASSSARALQTARKLSAPCTGYAFVVFRRMQDAARCVRHFELIRRHERSRDGVVDNVDFRQLYFRSTAKLDVTRSCEPSDIIWQNLKFGHRRLNAQNLKTILLVFGVSCVSTTFITAANFMAQSGLAGQGALTTVWVTIVVIVSNVVIFIMVPALAVNSEVHHYRSTQQTHMLLKMAFFQVFNTTIASLVFLFIRWHKPPGPACPGVSPPPPPPIDYGSGLSCIGALPGAPRQRHVAARPLSRLQDPRRPHALQSPCGNQLARYARTQ